MVLAGFAADISDWFSDLLASNFAAVMTLVSGLSTLAISNHFADRREARAFLRQQLLAEYEFKRQVLCDLQDAVSEDHAVALRGNHEASQLAELGIHGLISEKIGVEAGQIASKVRNLAARIDDEEIRNTVAELRDLHNYLLITNSDHPKRETWRVGALDAKDRLDSSIREHLYPKSAGERSR